MNEAKLKKSWFSTDNLGVALFLKFTKQFFSLQILEQKNILVGKMLLENGIYSNLVMCPAVSLKDSRIRMSLMSTHTKEYLNKALNVFEYFNKKLEIA